MEDQMLTYPTDKVVAVAPDHGIVEAARAALRASGVDESQIEVLGGEGVGRAEPTEDDDQGVVASVIRTVRTGLGEEATRLRQLNEAIDAGQFVVQVDLSDEDGDARDDEKRSVGNALHDAGASHVAFYGKMAVEELQIGA